MSFSTLVSSDIEYANVPHATKLRDLDAFEEFFWLLEQVVPVFHVVIAEISGPTTIGQWREALDAVEIRYPLLSASIRKVAGTRPFFEKKPRASIPLRMAPLDRSLELEEEMEKELQISFGDGSGPLTRAKLFHSDRRSVIMFATHHSSLDGKSHLLLMQDLLAAVAGEDVGGTLEVQPGLGQLLGLPAPCEYVKKRDERFSAPERQDAERTNPRVLRLQFGVEETEFLQRRAREERTTVHSALVAALALAGKRCSKQWNEGPVRCLSPIDMRKILGIPEAAGLLVSSHHSSVLTPDGASLWDIARAIREEMLSDQSTEGATRLVTKMSSMVAEERTPEEIYESALNGPLAHELLLTNYAGYRVRTEYENLRIENLFTGSPSVLPASQKVSVLTVNGRLGMTLVARDVFPTLLEDAREILTRVPKVR